MKTSEWDRPSPDRLPDLTSGFLEALEIDMERELEASHVSTGILEEGSGFATLKDWSEVQRDQRQSGYPNVPSSEFRMPCLKVPGTATTMNGSMVHSRGGGGARVGFASAPLSAAQKKAPSKATGFDLNSFTIPDWSLAKGWRNRPKRKSSDRATVLRDIHLFKDRFQEAKRVGTADGKGFRFGAHGDAASSSRGNQDFYNNGGQSSSIATTETLRRLRRSLTSLEDVDEELNSLSGKDKLSCLLFKVTMTQSRSTYNPADVQGILRFNRSALVKREDVANRLSTPAGSRTGPRNVPILLPRSGSPLSSTRQITFSTGKRFPYDPDLRDYRRPKTQMADAFVDDDDDDTRWE